MRILVAIKRVVDAYVAIRLKADGTGPETNNVKMSMNPFDEIALEAAIRLKEQGIATEVIAVSIGAPVCQETLRTALALGADSAILVSQETHLEPLNIAKILQALVSKFSPEIVFLGKQAIDSDDNQVGQMLAGLLNWPQGTFLSALSVENKTIQIGREVDGGIERLALQLPAVLTTDLRLNEPRFATLPNIMKAKQKPLQTLTLGDLGLSVTEHTKTLTIEPPDARQAGVKVESVAELVRALQAKGVIA